MSPAELREACQYNLSQGGDVVLLTLPGPPPKRGYYMRLLRTRGPLGEIINTNQSTGDSVVRFKATAVLKFIDHEQAEPGNHE